MKYYNLLLVSVAMLLASCSALPEIAPIAPSEESAIRQQCKALFPQGKWQFVHSIEANMAGGRQTTMIGVTSISSTDLTIHCVMMTIEGLVLFDGVFDGQKIIINRGVPPFDSPSFAKGMIDDIRLIFFHPQTPAINAGSLEDGALICRFHTGKKTAQDVVIRPNGSWMIRRYQDNQLKRIVRADVNANANTARCIPDKITLNAHGSQGSYSLILKRIE
ncbi:hypothetical protein QUF75_06495 [Desulfococcaceae bacterium HSG7]|nr:hypothetical protein [Desulfococcaceae bacterium HSG7]